MIMDKKKIKCYSLQEMGSFKGFVKNGLDSSTIINLIIVFDSEFNEFKRRGFTFPLNLFYYHEISQTESIGVLINKHNFTKNEAIGALNKLIEKFNLKQIKRIPSDELYEKLAEEANNKIIKEHNRPDLKIGEQDIIIIGGFIKEKITFVHSGDEGFLKTCEELKINTVRLPKQDIQKENEIKKWMRKR